MYKAVNSDVHRECVYSPFSEWEWVFPPVWAVGQSATELLTRTQNTNS